jgi:hypothetical protein
MAVKPMSGYSNAQKMEILRAELGMSASYILFAVCVTVVVVAAMFASMAVAIPFGLLALTCLIGAIICTREFVSLKETSLSSFY